jgi:hypothetical protein
MTGFSIGGIHFAFNSLETLLAFAAGILALLLPRSLHYIVAVYLLAIGTIGLLRAMSIHGISPIVIVSLVAGIMALVQPRLLHIIVGVYLIIVGVVGAVS